MATIPSVQLFRNSNIITGRQAAIDALEAQKAKVADGGLILARYSEDGSENGVKTLLGIVRNGGGTNVQLTVIDVEGAAQNVQSAITSAIDSLNKGDAEVEGKYVSSVSEDKGIITVTRKPLPSVEKKVSVGKAVTAVTQTNGKINVEFGGVAAANVSVADEGNKFTATNVEGALYEIKDSLDAAIGVGGTVAEQITNAINALDSSATSTNNYFDVTVAQENGKITGITVTNKDIASAELLGTITDTKDKATAFGRIAQEVADRKAAIGALNFGPVGDTGKVITAITQTNGVVNATADTLSASSVLFRSSGTSFTADNVKDALDTLYTRSGDGSKVTLDTAEGSEGSNVLKVYTIKQGGEKVGEINIPKDLVVKSGSVVKGNWNDGVFTENVSGSGTALKLVIANKEETPIYINTLDLVKDHTAGNGIAISDTNVISVQVAEGSEGFLTVGADGVKLSGVQAAINKANTKVEKTDGGSHVTLTSTTSTTDSSVTYTIGESDIASASALEDETTNRQNADTELSNRLGDAVTTDLTATAQLRALSGSPIDGKDVTSVYGAKAYAKDLVDNLNAEVGSTTGTSKTEAIKIVQAHGKIDSITLGAFDCGTY